MRHINITILYGSSCVGKSTIMGRQSSNYVYAVEMDDSAFWELDKSEWSTHCLTYLSESIAANTERKNVIVTCGGLPLPNHPKYTDLEKEHEASFTHTLVLTRTTEEYRQNIVDRGLAAITEDLMRDYTWRKSTIDFYDTIMFNTRGDVSHPYVH